MATALTLLDDIQIASPCHARWEDMPGDARARHCRSCKRMVYDLSSLTAAEATSLLQAKEGALCVRLFRRADGRILTADCPEGLRAKLLRFADGQRERRPGWTVAPFVVGLIAWLIALLFGLTRPPPAMGAICPPGRMGGSFVDPDEPELLPPPRKE